MDADNPGDASPEAIDAFIARWRDATGTERANYQLFLTELCALLGLPQPDPAREDTRDNAYCFERRIIFQHGDGTQSQGFIDLYRRACYVMEFKQTGLALDTGVWDKAMLRAHGQAVQYARGLPPEEGRPPFVVVVDVGRSIELYSEFSRTGGAYIPYPDPRSHRIRLDDLRRPEIRARLRAVWLDPLSLDPTRRAARVTREIAQRLARLAVSLEASGHPPELAAAFLIRCLFTLFAEDVGLLPKAGFTELLRSVRDNPAQFVPLTEHLWRDMNEGTDFSVILRERVLRFNGRLFAEAQALPLNRDQIDLLIAAGSADWRHVEPAIFGTLLERALDPLERHKLGAHYTPRAYVERLVLPTVIEPLREEWTAVHSAAFSLHEQGKDGEAIKLVSAFQVRLANVRVLDPACGSGNFLYVTLEHLKRLEGEVLDTLDALGQRQMLMELAGVSVDPHQLLGLELNPRAATIAEMVLWIGYLQWHFRTHGNVNPPEPVIRDFRNIQCRDAVLAYDRVEWVTDEQGRPVTRWDGRTFKPHPVTGEPVPDDSAQIPLERYVNPRPAEWPAADFVVGNPPFIGSKRMRELLGDGYIDAVQAAWPEIPQASDFVLRWWHHAALLTRSGKVRRFGFITTNSTGHSYNRRVLEPHLSDADRPLAIVYAVPDHPWVDAADGAAVRIAMTVGEAGSRDGVQAVVTKELDMAQKGSDDLVAEMAERTGRIHADLSAGANLTSAVPLRSNEDLCAVGFKTIGSGFVVDRARAEGLGLGTDSDLAAHIRPYINGRDLAGTRRGIYVLDFFEVPVETLRKRYPACYQHLLAYVLPERQHNRNPLFRSSWWVIGHPRPIYRRFSQGLPRVIATIETSKHRFFSFLPTSDAPDSTLVTFGLEDGLSLGLLSSRVHIAWALAAGGTLEDRPRYNKTRCFETFPFPDPPDALKARIRQLAEELDALRKARQAEHPGLTMTGMYNVLERLRRGEPLSAKDKTIHEQGLVSVLGQLHDELDAAVLAAYGWEDLAPRLVGRPGGTTPLPDKPADQAEAEEELLTRLVALNRKRAAEEARRHIRWLRPDFQAPGSAGVSATAPGAALPPPSLESSPAPGSAGILPAGSGGVPPPSGRDARAPSARTAWPKTLPEQFHALRAALAEHAACTGPATAEQLAQTFARAPRAKVAELLETLAALGHARRLEDGRYLPA